MFCGICVFVCLHDIAKTDTVRITKLDLEMFHDESWKPIYFVVKRSRSRVVTSLSVFKQNTVLLMDAYVSLAQAMLATPGFP